MSKTTPQRGGGKFLAQIWRSDPHVRRFDRDRDCDCSELVDVYDALFVRDADALFELEQRAWSARNLRTYLALGEVLRRRDALTRKSRTRFVSCLLAVDRNQDALDLLQDPGAVRHDQAAYWFNLATALARTGRLPQALDAIREAVRIDPALEPAAALKARLEQAGQVETVGRTPWPELQTAMDFYVELGLGARAARLLAAFMTAPPLPFAEKSAVMEAVVKLIECGDRGAIIQLLEALPRLYPDSGAQARIEAALRAVRGEDARGSSADEPGSQDRDLDYCLAFACAEASAWPDAIDRLGQLSLEHKTDMRVRNALARCVGRQVLRQTPFHYGAGSRRRRVFNLVPFNNEMFLLRLRLDEMADWVDKFVVIESRFTFTGLPKPLHFAEAKADFAPFADKIIHVVIDAFPDFAASPWARDFYQRDMGVCALSGLCARDDLVLLTDADEIVRRQAVQDFDGEFANLRMETYRYFLNNRLVADRRDQRGTGAIWRAEHLARHGSSYARFALSQYDPGCYIHDAGWHFTSIYNPPLLAEKVKSYAHQEYAHRDESHFGQVLARLRAGHREPGWEAVALDETFPAYIRRNQNDLADFILRDAGEAV